MTTRCGVYTYRKRIYTEEKGRRCCLGDRQERKGWIHPIIQILLVQNSQLGMELNKLCPPNSSDDLYLFFCLYPSSMVYSVQDFREKVYLVQVYKSFFYSMCTLYSKSVQYSGERLVDWWGYKRGLSHSALFGTRRFDYSTLWFSSSCLPIAYLWKQFQAAFLRLLVRYSISKIEMFFFVLCCKICGVWVQLHNAV